MMVCEKEAMSANVSLYVDIYILIISRIISNRKGLVCHLLGVSFQNYLVSLTLYQDTIWLVYPPRHVVLKVIKKKNVRGNEASVWTEIDLLTGLDHPNIVCLSLC